MTHQPPSFAPAPADDPGRRIAQLREALALVERLAGRPPRADEAGLDEAARISAAHESAPPVARRRFDALAAESAAWTAAGVDALLAGESKPSAAAANRLADAIDRTLNQMAFLLR